MHRNSFPEFATKLTAEVLCTPRTKDCESRPPDTPPRCRDPVKRRSELPRTDVAKLSTCVGAAPRRGQQRLTTGSSHIGFLLLHGTCRFLVRHRIDFRTPSLTPREDAVVITSIVDCSENRLRPPSGPSGAGP
eukprot:649458-Rhodomonas_salina.2